MPTFKKSVLIDADINKLFDFHTNPDNLNKISPSFLDVKIKSITDIPLIKNSEIVLQVSNFGIVSEWIVKIAECNRPNLVKDIQIKGLFKFWEHSHIFTEENGKVRMTDEIVFIPPFGLLGYLAYPFIIIGLNSMFRMRHAKTKNLFEINRKVQ